MASYNTSNCKHSLTPLVYIAECETDDKDDDMPTIAGLTVQKTKHYVMKSIR